MSVGYIDLSNNSSLKSFGLPLGTLVIKMIEQWNSGNLTNLPVVLKLIILTS